MAEVIDGKAIAVAIQSQVSGRVRQLATEGHSVKLVSVMVGNPSAGEVYSRSQAARCSEVGIEYELRTLPADADRHRVESAIAALNADPTVNGIMLNLPLPARLNESEMQYCIDRYKDVEGVNPANIGFVFYGRPIIAPCTALSILEILRHIGRELRGSHVVIVGQGAIVGRPITLFLLQEEATVTACHKATRDLKHHTSQADILIVAAGKPRLISGEMIKRGAVVIDVGINRLIGPDGQPCIVGDVDAESVHPVASALSPVPGGVGPVTVAILLRNTLEAAAKQRDRRTSSDH